MATRCRSRAAWLAALLTVVVLAGCAAKSPSPATGDRFGGPAANASATTGVVRGVVVDEAIRPIAGAAIVLSGPAARNGTSDAQGRFAFGDLTPGNYVLHASHPIFAPAQTTAEAVAGLSEPPAVRIQLSRLFSQEPYSEAIKFDGFIQCGYDAIVLTSQCVNDYTTIVYPGGLANQLRSVVDNRGYVTAVGAGWQVMVYELTWEPTAQGTSANMFFLVSYFNRTASDEFGQAAGPHPVLLRLEVGVKGDGQGGMPELIPPEGRPDLYVFAGVAAGGGLPVGAGFSQPFTFFQHNFYYGIPPPDWSFVGGDLPPF